MTTRKNKWASFFSLFFVGVAFAMNNLKVPPNMLNMTEVLGCSFTPVGNLMAIVGVCGILFTLPGGMLVKRFGPRKIGAFGITCALAGSIISVLCSNIYVMLASRFIEAVGFCLCPVVAMTLISMWFPPEKRGLPLGIWNCWITLGMFIMFNVSSSLTASYDYYGSFWLAVFLLAASLVLFLVFIEMPQSHDKKEATEVVKHRAETFSSLEAKSSSVFRTPAVWFLALAFLCFAFLSQCLISFYSTYMQLALGVAPALANASTSMAAVGGIAASIIVGLLLNRLPSKTHSLLLLFLSFFATMCAFFLFRYTDASTIALFAVLTGFVIYMIPATIFSIVPTLVPHPSLIPVGIAIVNIAQNISGALHGILVAPMITDIVRTTSADWSAPATLLTGIAIVLVIASFGQYFVIGFKQNNGPRKRLFGQQNFGEGRSYEE